MAILVTFPPNAPPILLTWQVTLLDGTSSVSATASCNETQSLKSKYIIKLQFISLVYYNSRNKVQVENI